jgi:hypothetical protein
MSFIWYSQRCYVKGTVPARAKERKEHKLLVQNLLKNICWKHENVRKQIKIEWMKHCKIIYPIVRFEVFTAVTMKNAVFWDVTPSRSCVNRRFGVTRSTLCHIPEDGILLIY